MYEPPSCTLSVQPLPVSTTSSFRRMITQFHLFDIPTILPHIHIAGVPPEENSSDKPHQDGIKHIQRPLVSQQVPIMSHGILHNPENAPDHDERTHDIQHIEILLPLDLDLIALHSRVPANSPVEDRGRDGEDAEHDDLDHQSGDDDILSQLHVLPVARGHHAAGAALHEEGEDVARHEDLGQPVGSDEREMCAVDGEDDARERHVYGGGEEGGAEEDEDVLDDVGDHLVGFVLGEGACGVAYDFDCWGVNERAMLKKGLG